MLLRNYMQTCVCATTVRQIDSCILDGEMIKYDPEEGVLVPKGTTGCML